jgi:hypothetical protein
VAAAGIASRPKAVRLLIWINSKSKWFDFYEMSSNWPRCTRYQRYSTSKIIFSTKLEGKYLTSTTALAKKISKIFNVSVSVYTGPLKTPTISPRCRPKSPGSVNPKPRRKVLDQIKQLRDRIYITQIVLKNVVSKPIVMNY